VLDSVVPEGPIVLVGHSMGGMTIIALAEQHPELFGDRDRRRLPDLHHRRRSGAAPGPGSDAAVDGRRAVAQRLVSLLARGSRTVDGLRRVGRSVAMVATDELAFGGEVPRRTSSSSTGCCRRRRSRWSRSSSRTSPSLDKFETVKALSVVPTTIICGTEDKLTSIGHSRKLHAYIPGSSLLECDGAGHW
jgi:pimeloyl-ACP methyl ester carboxylesterase